MVPRLFQQVDDRLYIIETLRALRPLPETLMFLLQRIHCCGIKKYVAAAIDTLYRAEG